MTPVKDLPPHFGIDRFYQMTTSPRTLPAATGPARWKLSYYALLLIVASSVLICLGQEPPPAIPPVEPTIKRLLPKDPQEALATFTLAAGFQVELVAHEPLLRDPVAICYDESGAMYAVEMTAYPHPDNPKEMALGQVRKLLDDDQDGRFDTSHLFADSLSTPTSVLCWDGGVFVIAAPDLWYLKDTDGDHIADHREKVFTGFGISSAETLANNLKWGIDNKIYGATSHSGGNIRPANDPQAATVSISGHDFRFDPRTRKLETLSWATSRWGNSFDDNYNRFVCQNTGPARHVVLPRHYLIRNPALAVESVYQSLALEAGTEPVFRTSPPEPWRLVRAYRRQSLGKPANPGEINATGYFTASCGITIYRGAAWPLEFRGNLFVGDAAGNLVHRRTLTPHGATFQSTRGEEGSEFMSSSDNFFRPVNFINAPDGTLHVVDMYREVVEGPSWVPEDLKEKGLVDVHGGSDRGRVYRVAPEGFVVPAHPRLGDASTIELVQELENPNSWWRETAQRLLMARRDTAATAPLKKLLHESSNTLARIHALWLLDGLQLLSNADLARCLMSQSSKLQEQALRVAESRLAGSEQLTELVLSLAGSPDKRLRFQIALTLGEINDRRVAPALAQILHQDHQDVWLRTAVLSSSYRWLAALATELLPDKQFVEGTGGRVLRELMVMLSTKDSPAEMKQVLAAISTFPSKDIQIELLAPFLRAGHDEYLSTNYDSLLATLAPRARLLAEDAAATAGLRADAITLFVRREPQQARLALPNLIDTVHPTEVQLAALRALSRFSDEQTGSALVSRAKGTTPQVRGQLVELLASKDTWVSLLLKAVEERQFSAGEFSSLRRERLLAHDDDSIRQQAVKLLGEQALGQRQDVIDAYQPALSLAGDAERGKQLFIKECTACHRFGKLGHDIAPNLSDYGRKLLPPASLMAQILDPNREVASNYISYGVILKDGRIVSGIITSQSPGSITLKGEKNLNVTILRRDIEEIRSSGKSLMPEGMEKKLTHQQMSDLLEFLAQVNQRI